MRETDALLINPVSARSIPAFVPHGLLSIASFAIQAGYRIRVYDRNVEDIALEAVLSRARPRVVGLGCLTGTAIDDAVSVSKRIKSFDPSINIVWGGVHTSLYPDSVLRQEYVDFVVRGDGEEAFCGLLDHIFGKRAGLGRIKNLGYKDGYQLRYNEESFVNLNSLPLPAWSLIRVEKYLRSKFYARRVLTVNTSRGCPYNCSFCCVPRVHKRTWRAQSAEKVVENLTYLKIHYGIDGFQVDDDEFDIDRSRVLKLCTLLRQQGFGFKWSHFSRVNIVQEEVIREEALSGLRLIEFGVESGSSRILEFLNKGQTVAQIENAFAVCKKVGLKTSALFMIGLPTENDADISQTVGLIRRLDPYLTICTVYRPYPGTELFDYCVKDGRFSYTDDLERVGKLYSASINVSLVPTESIRMVKRRFDRNNIYQEIRFIVLHFKVRLFFYYLWHYIIRPGWKTEGDE